MSGAANSNVGNSPSTSQVGQSGNSTTNVDTSQHDSYRAIYIPPVVRQTPPSIASSGNGTTTVLPCGPLQEVKRNPVNGHYFGFWSTSKIELGYNDQLVQYKGIGGDPQYFDAVNDHNGYMTLYGVKPIIVTTVVGVAGARNIGLGGGGGGGNWGQAGGGSSSSMQQIETHIILRTCMYGKEKIVIQK